MIDMLRRLLYPAVMVFGLTSYEFLRRSGVPFGLAAYASVGLGLLAVLLFERVLPYRRDWQPTRRDLMQDVLFLAVVQVGVPALCAAGAGSLPRVSGPWPHEWPLVLQLGAMLLVADLLRYWLHVAAHRFRPLWRLHAVHHAPAKLYGLNVVRFHPLEKAMQYCLDALPFVLLGVGSEVLALYFVFYAIHGFFQHSNVDVRLGVLNWIVSGPELHRWHHSENLAEAGHNFGNNLIVWDVVFGTRWLPADAHVQNLGNGMPRRDFTLRFASFLMRVQFVWIRATHWIRFRHAARRPQETQLRVLREILRRNRGTRFGAEHDFAAVRSIADFRARVPIQDYEALRPYIDQQDTCKTPALTSEPPVAYARTSGTTGEPKFIPVLARTLATASRQHRLSLYAQFRSDPKAHAGAILAILGAAVEGHRPSGTPYGSTSGHLGQLTPGVLQSKFAVPSEVFDVDDYELRYLLILRLALGRDDITMMGSANPSTFVHLAGLLRRHRKRLLEDCQSGGFTGIEELPSHVRRAVQPRLAMSASRRHQVTVALTRRHPRLRDCWPSVRMVSTWKGGSCHLSIGALRRELPRGARIAELGYLASEMRGTVNVDVDGDRCVPCLQDHFFEFVDERGRVRSLHELERGSQYRVLVTTASGLYRYDMNDIVRVTGFFEATPTLEFVRKGEGVTNITGEKLSECQVTTAVRRVFASHARVPGFVLALADSEARRYRLLLDVPVDLDLVALSRRIETQLGRLNVEYREKRKSGRLFELSVCPVRRGADAAYRRHCVAQGQRDSQFKMLALQRVEDVEFDWADWIAGERASWS